MKCSRTPCAAIIAIKLTKMEYLSHIAPMVSPDGRPTLNGAPALLGRQPRTRLSP
jgi:hypothetical protein